MVSTSRALKTCLLLMSLLPLGLFAHLGGSSRIMGDDWCYFASANWLGFRDHFEHFYTTLHGSYSYITLHELMSRFGAEATPPVFPTFLIIFWMAGYIWLLWLFARRMPIAGDRFFLALSLASLTVSATIYAFPDWEALYWYSGSSRHILPLCFFFAYLALSWQVARRIRSRTGMAVYACAGGLVCFVAAGFYELYALLQAMYFCLILAWIMIALRGEARAWALPPMLAGLIASAASLLLQMSSPGAANRVEQFSALPYAHPIHYLPELAIATLRTSFEFIGNQAGLAGFTLMLAVGLVAALTLLQPPAKPPSAARRSLPQSALILLAAGALLALSQLYGLGYGAVACLYIGALALLGFLCWRLRPPQDALAIRLGLAALLFLALTVITIWIPVAAGHYTLGTIYPRSITNSVVLQAITGLIWGVLTGYSLRVAAASAPASQLWTRVMLAGGCALAFASIAGIVLLQLDLSPKFAIYAQEFDARHARIERLRDSGERVIEVEAYSFDMPSYIASRDMPLICRGTQHYYYGVDQIIHLAPGEKPERK